MAVRYLATKTEPRCAICSSPHRADIDLLLEKRSNREKIGDRKVSLDYVTEYLAELGIYKGNAASTIEESLQGHLRKHCERVNEATTAATDAANSEKQAAMLAQVDELLARDPSTVDIESGLRRIIQIGLGEVEARLARGERSGVTLDHALKAAQELARRGQNEQQASLLRTLADGIGTALGGAPKELPPGQPVIDATPAEYTPIEVEPEEAFGE